MTNTARKLFGKPVPALFIQYDNNNWEEEKRRIILLQNKRWHYYHRNERADRSKKRNDNRKIRIVFDYLFLFLRNRKKKHNEILPLEKNKQNQAFARKK
jgi:hypothetical protein